MNMKELGDLLRTEREKSGLSLDDVHESTKISKSALRSLEAGTADDLPHPVYTKGFIKNYAELLGLDGDELAAEFTRTLSREGRYEEMEEAHEAVMAAESEPKPGRGTVLSIAVTLILLAVLGWLVYDLYIKPPAEIETSSEKQSGTALNATPGNATPGDEGAAVPGPAETPTEAPPTRTAAPAAKKPPAKAAQPQAKPAAQDLPRREETSAPPSATGSRNASLAASGATANGTEALEPEKISYAPTNETLQSGQTQTAETAGQADAGQHRLRIEATEACWFQAQVDGAARDVYLRPGESVTLTFSNDLMIKLGNAGGVSLSYNGQEYPLEASSGEVKTLTFP